MSNTSSFNAKTPAFVKSVASSTGGQPYANHGTSPININSSKADLIKAYPHAAGGVERLSGKL